MSDYLRILRQYWGYSSFRGIQREIIESIGAGRDTLGLMPTGGGKSITFQVPALAQEGVCIVVSPLIALMKDQVAHLRERGIMASAVCSDMSRQDILKTLDNCVLGATKLLYVSPERLSSDLFLNKVRHMQVSFITVDEAHCISQWGYDFRPSYLHIADLRKVLGDVPVLALTATATPRVIDDIQERLMFRQKNVFRMSFERKNLAYVVRHTMDKDTQLVHILQSVPGSAIVYARSRKRTKNLARMLAEQHIDATFFHAGLEPSVKDARQTEWQQGQKRVIVCTNAFGMGIDKPDVRLVVHYDLPDSVEAYFQEAGRAGRDGGKAYAVLLYNESDDRKLHKRVAYAFPEKEYVKDVYDSLAYYYTIAEGSGMGCTFEFDLEKFCFIYRYYPLVVDSALKILQNAGYITYETDPDHKARCMFLIGRDELYRIDNEPPLVESVITALLRSYSGLFTDYVYIELGLLATKCGQTEDQVYQVLRSLTQRRIMNFIPQRKKPYITYLCPRELREHVVIPESVYEQRKQQFTERIEAMLAYVRNDKVCRSRQLLAYFGEDARHDCHQCDVCLSHEVGIKDEQVSKAEQAVLDLLADKQRHSVEELNQMLLPDAVLDAALETLINEERIQTDGYYLYL